MSDPRRVLIVDDELMIREALVEALELEGYEARGAADGREALAVLDGWTPEVIVLDLMMPEMDGWQFREAQRARADARDIPVVVLSATRRLKEAEATIAPVAVVAKPFQLEQVFAAVERALARPTAGDAAH